MTRNTRRAGIGAFLVAVGSVIAVLALSTGPAGAQTAPIPNPAQGTDSRGDTNSVCSGGDCLAQFNSTGSGNAIARNGSDASGCSEASNNSTTSGAVCPPAAAAAGGGGGTSGAAVATTARLAMTGPSGTIKPLAGAAALSLLFGLALVGLTSKATTRSAV